ncbi:MAG: hypothetical protein ACLTCB_00310 [Merdibacter sp.]
MAILAISIVCMGVNGFSGNGVSEPGIDFISGATRPSRAMRRSIRIRWNLSWKSSALILPA